LDGPVCADGCCGSAVTDNAELSQRRIASRVATLDRGWIRKMPPAGFRPRRHTGIRSLAIPFIELIWFLERTYG
jgi:hypothetical protein